MTDSKPTAKQVDQSKIWKAGLMAIVASLAVNLLVYFILNTFLDLPAPADFPPLSAPAIAFLTTLFTFFAVVVFAIVARVSANPVRTYWIVAAIAFVLSIIPNLLSALNPEAIPFPFPGATTTAFLVLIVFHILAFLMTAGILTTQTLAD